MKVKELIEALQRSDPETEVQFGLGDSVYPIRQILGKYKIDLKTFIEKKEVIIK